MKKETMKCDVLVIGGGVGGLACAASVKERMPEAEVIVVEKNFAGYSGKANRGGGVLQYFDPTRVKAEDFLRFHVNEIGCYLGNQDLMLRYVNMNTEIIEKMESWGVNIPREENGNFHVRPTGPMTAMICVDLDLCLKIRRVCEKQGVRFLDKTVMADLLTTKLTIKKPFPPSEEVIDVVNGALCYSVLDGTTYVINARQVVLATGSQNYRFSSMWSSGRGDGIAAAYRAGTKLRNVEFGNFTQLMRVKSHNEVVFGENNMYNAKGEFITPNFRSHRETDINSNAVWEWYKQMKAGNGPVHLEFEGGPMGGIPEERAWGRPYGRKFRELNDSTAAKIDGDDFEVCPMLVGEQSPICTDTGMRATLKGLYAIGDCSYSGSAAAGAVPAPPGRNRGSGILNAVFAAMVCGETIDNDAHTPGGTLPVDEAQVEKLTANLMAPLERKEGCSAEDVIEVVHQAMCPSDYSVIMSEERIAEALKIVMKAKEMVPTMKANDWHELMCCHEAEAMVLSAELHYRASDLRKESRGWFLREDYPERDDANWLKWIDVVNKDGEMSFSTTRLPVETWPVKPDKSVIPTVPVTEEEKAGPLYKYFTRTMVEADPALYSAVSMPCDPAKAISPLEMNKLFDEGYLDMELGYCNLPDGTAVLANKTFFPGCTPEMFDFWFAWHGVAAMRYKIWNPQQHYSVQTMNMDKAMDKSLSLKERYWDTTHDVFEDCGDGPQRIFINFRKPTDIGFDEEKWKNFKGTIVCAGNEKSPTIMCHFMRPVEGGCELRSRFWMGWHVVNGKPEKLIPDGMRLPLDGVKSLLTHNIKEFTNLAAILPEVYNEFVDEFTK